MQSEFYIRRINENKASSVIEEIGFDKPYINKAKFKYNFILLKIHNLTCPQATIVKQLALSIGADAAVNREVITCKIDKTDLLLGCTLAQLKILCEKLKQQPFKLSKLAELLLDQAKNYQPEPIEINNRIFDWNKKTYVMGILNITPDSFSDGGMFFDITAAEKAIVSMLESGVDIIDVGGETTKPFSKEVLPEEELQRVLPAIKKIREIDANIPISVDTRHSIVAYEAIQNGANIINDVSGFDWDSDMSTVVANLNVPIVIMHSLSSPETMQINPQYSENIVDAVYKSLYDKVNHAIEKGIKKNNIIIDPGIGFGKTLEHNIELIQRISEFKSLGLPILVGVSRKSIISNILNVPPLERDDATLALNSYLASNGANILRVHNVPKNTESLKVLDRIIKF